MLLPSLMMFLPDGYIEHSIDLRNSRTINSSDYAWAAGIIDGEGCILRHPRKTIKSNGKVYRDFLFKLSISQASSDGIPEILTRFQTIFKCGVINGPYKNSSILTKKPMYLYIVRTDQAKAVIRKLWLYLGDVKRQQAINAGYIP